MPDLYGINFSSAKIGENQYEYSLFWKTQLEKQLKTNCRVGRRHSRFAFASGSAAIYTVFSMFSAGDHFVIGNDVYGGTFRLIDAVLKRFGMTFTVVDNLATYAAVEEAITPNTKAIYLKRQPTRFYE